MTLPSLLNMLTSSMAWMGWTLSFFSEAWSFLSSPADRAGARLTFLRGVPLPLFVTETCQNLGLLRMFIAISADSCLDIPCRPARVSGLIKCGEVEEDRASNIPMRAEAPSFLSLS